jgi:hypothetical protein
MNRRTIIRLHTVPGSWIMMNVEATTMPVIHHIWSADGAKVRAPANLFVTVRDESAHNVIIIPVLILN